MINRIEFAGGTMEDDPIEILVDAPDDPSCVYVFGHGAGAGMTHRFMSSVAALLVERSIAVVRFNLRYMTAGRRYPDRPPELYRAADAAIRYARSQFPDLKIFAGGKSMGGRVTADAVSLGQAPAVDGFVFFGYPLHAPGKSSTDRANHLLSLQVPMLFLQGSRDKLADPDLMREIAGALPSATLHFVSDADHSFNVPKRTGMTHEEVLANLADAVVAWLPTE